jgi:16S rRNA (guanine(966)-N(2))-methyltransferase RsmD
MRVIAGSLKGRRLQAPDWDGLRPTSDKLRETLFNVVAPRIAGARVLDGYAGTGAVGIEAISRGATWVAFVDQDARARALIAGNLAHCGIETGYTIVRAPLDRALDTMRGDPAFAPFDLVLLDPPYDTHAADVLTGIDRVIAPGGLVVLEHARRATAPEAVGGLARVRQVLSGDSVLTLYQVH